MFLCIVIYSNNVSNYFQINLGSILRITHFKSLFLMQEQYMQVAKVLYSGIGSIIFQVVILTVSILSIHYYLDNTLIVTFVLYSVKHTKYSTHSGLKSEKSLIQAGGIFSNGLDVEQKKFLKLLHYFFPFSEFFPLKYSSTTIFPFLILSDSVIFLLNFDKAPSHSLFIPQTFWMDWTESQISFNKLFFIKFTLVIHSLCFHKENVEQKVFLKIHTYLVCDITYTNKSCSIFRIFLCLIHSVAI